MLTEPKLEKFLSRGGWLLAEWLVIVKLEQTQPQLKLELRLGLSLATGKQNTLDNPLTILFCLWFQILNTQSHKSCLTKNQVEKELEF